MTIFKWNVENRIQYLSNDDVNATSLAGDDAASFPIWMEVVSKYKLNIEWS
jgi:hypothetical protein